MMDDVEYSSGILGRVLEKASPYFSLIKPRIVLLVTVTGLCAMILEGSLLSAPLRFAAVLLGIVLAAASAGALNQYYDREIDALMARTRTKRPIPAGKITPRRALYFGVVLGILALWVLQAAGHRLAAALALGAILLYVVVYTIWLKRRTAWNIVIGGAAGGSPPLIGWAAGAGDISGIALLMSLVIVLWTPPHFWALALYTQEDYALAGIPMLPVVAGESITRLQIMVYTAALLLVTAYLGIRADLGFLFLSGSTLLGLNLVRKVILLMLRKDSHSARALFVYSNVHLAALFAIMLLPK
jgi:heme o synthase